MVEVFTWGGGETLAFVFNAVAALTGSDDIRVLMRITLATIAIISALQVGFTGKLVAMNRVLLAAFLFIAAIESKVDVQITDKVRTASSSSVSNVPLGLALPAHYFSTVGNWAADAFETVFSLPNDLKFQGNGLVMAQKLLRDTARTEIADTRIAYNVSEFTQSCIYYGALAGWFDWDELVKQDDIWTFLNGQMGGLIFTHHKKKGATISLISCADAYTEIDKEWNVATTQTMKVMGMKTYPKETEAVALTKMISVLPQSFNTIANISKSAGDNLQQVFMVNAIRDGVFGVADKTGFSDSAALQSFATSVAQVKQRATYETLGDMASQTLAMLRNLYESFIYGTFVLVVFLVMISLNINKPLIMYLKSIAWLQIWPLLYTILNYISTIYAGDATTAVATPPSDFGAVGAVSSQVFAIITASAIAQENRLYAAMAGYMTWTIPAFSWSLIVGGSYAAAQVASAVGNIAQSTGKSTAETTSMGNIDYSNFKANNTSLNAKNTSPINTFGTSTSSNFDGSTTKMSAGGRVSTDYSPMISKTPTSMNMSSGVSSAAKSMVQQSQQVATDSGMAFSHGVSSNFQQKADYLHSHGNQWSNAVQASMGMSKEQFNQSQQAYNDIGSFAQKHGISRGQATELMANLNISGAMGQKFAAKAGLGGQGKTTAGYNNMMEEAKSLSNP
jgi:conjugal transfer mating pair stabilization protein TraG